MAMRGVATARAALSCLITSCSRASSRIVSSCDRTRCRVLPSDSELPATVERRGPSARKTTSRILLHRDGIDAAAVAPSALVAVPSAAAPSALVVVPEAEAPSAARMAAALRRVNALRGPSGPRYAAWWEL